MHFAEILLSEQHGTSPAGPDRCVGGERRLCLPVPKLDEQASQRHRELRWLVHAALVGACRRAGQSIPTLGAGLKKSCPRPAPEFTSACFKS
jgi:hypothetical protein